jgi:hypothetical protein
MAMMYNLGGEYVELAVFNIQPKDKIATDKRVQTLSECPL